MAIVVETGAIVAGANAYASLADLDTYHEDRLNTVWTNADDETKEAAMLRATAGLESKYRGRWLGFKADHNAATAPQFLAWPRRADKDESRANGYTAATMTKFADGDGIEYDVDAIPALIVQAYKEVCLIEITQPFVSVELSRDDMLKYQRVDVIEQEWLRNAPAVVQFPHVDALLSTLANSAPVMLGASIGLTEAEQDSLADTAAFDRWFQSLLVSP
jgi:hypothetical protein